VSRRNEWLRLASIGPHFLVSTLIGYFVGSKLDQWLGWEPVLTVVFALFGIAAGFLNLFRELAIINREEREELERQRKNDDDHDRADQT